MKAHAARLVLRTGIIFAPLALAACGGGGSDSPCVSNTNVCNALGKASTSAAATDNFTATNPNAGTLFTTSPSAVTLNAGSATTYTIGGGTPPYTATSGNTNVGRVSISGATLSLTGVAAGTSPVVVVDAVGKTVNIALTVLAQGQAGTAMSVAPGSLTVGDCTTNIPFIFSGGVAPYTIFTSDNFSVPVSSALPIGANSYFTATIKALNPNNIIAPTPAPYTAILTVLDSQSRTATATITVPSVHVRCPDNAVLQISPSTANFRPSEILAFQIAGGPMTLSAPQISFSDPSIAAVVQNTSGAAFNIQALKAGTTLMTVATADGQRANVTLTVLP